VRPLMAHTAHVKMGAKDAAPRSASTDILDALRVTLKAIGVTGVFALVGYIAMVAHGEFLGIQTEVANVTQLSLAAAQFWFDSVVILLQQAEIHWLFALAVISVFGLLSWPHIMWNRSSERFHFASEVGIVAALIAISMSALLWYQLPTIKLRDLMTVGLCAQPGASTNNVIDRGTNRLWSITAVRLEVE
jgi:hypothetical protein